MKPHIGSIVDRCYRLLDHLGEGGMGTVYRAEPLLGGPHVALKLVSLRTAAELPTEVDDESVQERLALAREFQTLASLHHPNVIRVLSYGFDEQFGPYFTMELLGGAKNILLSGSELAEDGKVQLIAQLLRALAYIHRRGVMHRDIKPGNILTVADEVKLLDFGIASEAGGVAELAGTAEYMAPELLQGESPSVRSDLYSAGVVFHQLLSGEFPKVEASMTAMLDAMLGEESTSTQCTEVLELTSPGITSPDSASVLDSFDLESITTQTPFEAARKEKPAIIGPLGPVVDRLVNRNPSARYDSADTALRDLAAAVPYPIPVETAATRESFLKASWLIGRDAELVRLRDGLDRSKHRICSAFLIGGESGVGKSRLLSELRTLALVHGCWVSDGQSVQEGAEYYLEWLPILRALVLRVDISDAEASVFKPMVPDIGSLLGRPVAEPPAMKPEDVQPRLLATLLGILSRLSRPLLIILEDLHWGRAESISLLQEVGARGAGLPLMLVGTYRTDESPELPGKLSAFADMPLRRLSEAQIAQLSVSMLGDVGRQASLVRYLEQQTEGNVFFLIEIVRALAENAGELRRIGEGELPDSVLTQGIERIIERRLERIPPAHRPLFQFAALLGRRFDLPVLENTFPDIPLRMLLIQSANAAVLESQGIDWRFSHDKLREAIIRQIPADKLAPLHRAVAESIEAVYVGERRRKLSSLLAYHYAQAGLPEHSLPYYLQASEDAMALCLYAEARVSIGGALSALALLSDSEARRRLRVDLLLRQVQTSLLIDKLDTQIARTKEVQDLLQSLAGPSGLAREDRLRNARMHYYLGRAYHYAGQPGEAIKRYQLVIPVAQEFGDEELLVLPSYVTGIALCMQGNSGKGCALLGQAVGPMETLGNAFEWLRGRLFYGLTLSASGRYQEGLQQMNQAFEHAQRIGQPSVLAMCQLMFSALHRTAQDWSLVAAAAQLTVEHASKSGDKVYLFAGFSYLAWAKSHLGEHLAGDEHRKRALSIAAEMGGKMIISDWFDAADGERAILAGKPELALTCAQAVVKNSQAAGLVLSHGLAERVWACALARLGAVEHEFDVHFQESVQILRRGDNLLDAAHTEAWWGRMYLERGNLALAVYHFESCKQQYVQSGLTTVLGEIEKLLTG